MVRQVPMCLLSLYLLHKSRPRDFFIQSLRDVTSQWSDGKQKLFKPVSQIRLCELFSFLWNSSVCYALSLFVLIKKNLKRERLCFGNLLQNLFVSSLAIKDTSVTFFVKLICDKNPNRKSTSNL